MKIGKTTITTGGIMDNHGRKLAARLIECTPLVDGRLVVDLIATDEPGSVFTKAALAASSIEEPDLGDVEHMLRMPLVILQMLMERTDKNLLPT